MIDISKGRFWDLPWSLISGCTPCSPGCDHCWALAMEKRFRRTTDVFTGKPMHDETVLTHPERLSIPLKRRKPTVYAVWNDFWHESVPDDFQYKAIEIMAGCNRHTFLVLTKRPHIAAKYFKDNESEYWDAPYSNIYWGLTVCNQQEADEKIPIFLQVPGKKFLSLEPLLGPVDLGVYGHRMGAPKSGIRGVIDAVILGGETGPGARPIQIEWVRSIRDQCQSAGVPFFFKSFGKYPPFGNYRLLDGRTHDELPWRKQS